ncbi:ethanolamine utilization protein EutH [Alkalicoccus chagannorensis]|uniref:ethanolamine utilization protein EutH n=1 Tax=Alkalicoccus chagannorensis TaxID=427072 RepID=UPI00042526B5|nr:ethanolamine utilization protein EutH [Alkalicoccus chagannorensis]
MADVIIYILTGCFILGLVDKAAGDRFGLGSAVDEGFQTMGPLAFVMIGMISAAPVLAELMRPFLVPLFTLLGADPSVFPGMFLAVDMGGYPLAAELAETEEAALFSGIILATMLGPLFVFTVPVALGFIHGKDLLLFNKGVLYGLVPVPAGALLGGVMAGMPLAFVIRQLIPVLVLTAVVVLLLLFFPRVGVKLFQAAGAGILMLTMLLLAATALQEITPLQLSDAFTPFPEVMAIVGSIVLVLAGAFPAVSLLKRLAVPLINRLGGKEPETWIGLSTQLAHCIPVFKRFSELSRKGKVMNAAFAVSGAFVLGGHLGFTAALEPGMAVPMMTAKITAGAAAVLLVFFLEKEVPAGVSE